jgi:hypothetical protein
MAGKDDICVPPAAEAASCWRLDGATEVAPFPVVHRRVGWVGVDAFLGARGSRLEGNPSPRWIKRGASGRRNL